MMTCGCLMYICSFPTMNHDEDCDSKTFLPPAFAMMSDMNVSEPAVQGEGSADSAANTRLLVSPAMPETMSIDPRSLTTRSRALSDIPSALAIIQRLSYMAPMSTASYRTTQFTPALRSLSAMMTCCPTPPSQNTRSGSTSMMLS